MKLRRDDVLVGRQAVGTPVFWAGVSGKKIVLQISPSSIRFNMLVSPAPWRSFVRTLKEGCRSKKYDGLSGYSFSKRCPMYYKAQGKAVAVKIAGRATWTTSAPKATKAAVIKTGWTDQVALEYRGITYDFTRDYFFKMREACLQLDTVLKTGQNYNAGMTANA